MDVLDRFCSASGQSISKDKFRVYFCKNIPQAKARGIVEALGIRATNDLGRYLGVPILHGRVTKHTYNFILDRLDNRLAGWKADNLSLAERVTLASSVLNSIPSYIMQTAFLPVYLCDHIDKKIRNFIWGSTEGSRRIHNVNWETVCKPKCLGGLGLRSARDLNKAFLMKLVWGMLSRPNELWVQVMLTKYMKNSGQGWCLKRRSGFSATWRGMLSVWSDTINGLQWSIRDGNRTKFWTDTWLDSGVTLIDFATNIQGVNHLNSVSDFCLENGSWDFNKLENCLPPEMVLQVGGMTPPRMGAGDDTLVWGLEDNGRFSIKSAYALLQEFRPDDRDRKWKRLWDWQGPNKIKHFMWIVMQGKLMTNLERTRRHISHSDTCTVCGRGAESLDQLFRYCDVATAVWNACLPQVLSPTQRQWDFETWWSNNVGFHDLKARDWVIQIHHIYREANFAADYLANLGHSFELGTFVHQSPDSSLLYWLRYDLIGVCEPRAIYNT
ncbi:Putative ribonuclease H protein At1g65750 [Linum perenne]